MSVTTIIDDVNILEKELESLSMTRTSVISKLNSVTDILGREFPFLTDAVNNINKNQTKQPAPAARPSVTDHESLQGMVREIRSLCHPDKFNNNPNVVAGTEDLMQEIFVEGTRLFKEKDASGLAELVSIVKNNRISDVKSLSQIKVIKAKKKISEIRSELDQLNNSPVFKIYTLYNSGSVRDKIDARILYLNLIKSIIK